MIRYAIVAIKLSTSLCGIGFAKKYPCIVEQPRRPMISTCSAVSTLDDAVEFQVAAQVDHRLDDVAGVLLRRDIANEASLILILSSDS
jgi:hypothetical protein